MVKSKMNIFIIRFISVILALSAMILGVTWKDENCFGDRIFESIGLIAWSNGTTGTHYPAIVALVMLTISFVLFTCTTKENGLFRIIIRGIIVLIGIIMLLSFVFKF